MGFIKLRLGVHRTPVINLWVLFLFVISLLDYYGEGEGLRVEDQREGEDSKSVGLRKRERQREEENE